ncbi:hypothetical protein DPMN_152468 [Dreissena polymorpha]|uniref:Uncharacterized protein n=1 Tax=Dreissena polymorpha TaxID=45954 RepID=A0A9D4FHI2_DREPO|nr:hypothetical protein DPMN_152468 [Dreissena polymorpha]
MMNKTPTHDEANALELTLVLEDIAAFQWRLPIEDVNGLPQIPCGNVTTWVLKLPRFRSVSRSVGRSLANFPPSLPPSLLPSLPHSLTPSLPHSLTHIKCEVVNLRVIADAVSFHQRTKRCAYTVISRSSQMNLADPGATLPYHVYI